MGHIFGQVVFVALVLTFAVFGIHLVLRAGARPYQPSDRAMRLPAARRLESRVLAAFIVVVATAVVAAVLVSWPIG